MSGDMASGTCRACGRTAAVNSDPLCVGCYLTITDGFLDAQDWRAGVPHDIHQQIASDIRAHQRGQRWRALKALWLPPVVDEISTKYRHDGVTDYRDNRDDDWTFWRAIKATIGIVLARFDAGDSYLGSFEMAYWDAGSTYGGYTVDRLWLYPRCRISIFNDGETFM